MKIKENAVIQNSLKLKSRAKYHLLVNSVDDFDELSEFVLSKKLNYFILGEGTNIIPTDFFNGIIKSSNLLFDEEAIGSIENIKERKVFQDHYSALDFVKELSKDPLNLIFQNHCDLKSYRVSNL